MGFFDEIKRSVSDMGQKTIQKTKEFSDSAKINSLISEDEELINQCYFKIGELYVKTHPEDYEDIFIEPMNQIYEAQMRLDKYRDQLHEIKGVQVCPNCGAEVTAEASFCNNCGAPLPKPVKPEVKLCPNCGAVLEEGAAFCSSCGSPVVEKKLALCSNCGAELEEGIKFCPVCGTRTENNES